MEQLFESKVSSFGSGMLNTIGISNCRWQTGAVLLKLALKEVRQLKN